MKKLLAGLVTGIFMFCVVGIANAALVTNTYDFTISNFRANDGLSTPPINPLIGSVTITFDPTRSYYNETNGITLNSLNFPLKSPIAFNYDEYGLQIGGGYPSSFWNNDFAAMLPSATCVSSVGYAAYVYAMNDKVYWSGDITINVYSTPTGSGNGSTSPTPIPAAIWIFGSGIAGLAGLRRRKKNRI